MKTTLGTGDTATLKSIFNLAQTALGFTHYVDLYVLSRLADAVLEVYVKEDHPQYAMTREKIEELAVDSINLLLERHIGLLTIKDRHFRS